jgi:hypothetical protein
MCKIQRRQGHFLPDYQNKPGATPSAAERRELAATSDLDGTSNPVLVTWVVSYSWEFPFWALVEGSA